MVCHRAASATFSQNRPFYRMSTGNRDIAAKAAYEKHIGWDISMAGDQAA
jgi:hypothetical protein